MSWLFPTPAPDIVQVAVPVSAATVTASPNTTLLLLNQAGLLAALTVTFPSSPADGRKFSVSSATVITTLTMNGGTINSPLAAFTVNGFARYVYSATTSSWWRVG